MEDRLMRITLNLKSFALLAFALLLFGFSHSVFAQDKYDVLEDLFGDAHKNYDFSDLYVLVEDIPENVKLTGLTKQQIQTDAEIRIQKAGLIIKKNAKQHIYINLNSIDIDSYNIYVIPSKQSKTIQIADGIYNYKASAARVSPLQGDKNFQKGYRYTWRFRNITVKR
jgi:hypothetical protein